MKLKIHVAVAVALPLLLLMIMGLWIPSVATAQEQSFVLGPGPDFEWSDYRGGIKGRVFLTRLSSLTISGDILPAALNQPESLLNNDFQIAREVQAVLWVDRLGLRATAEQRIFSGRHATGKDDDAVPQLDLTTSRIGLDLDLIRYPFLRFGINADMQLSGISLVDWRGASGVTTSTTKFTSDAPVTIGLQAAVIPARLREVPLYAEARVRAPVPFLEKVSKIGKVRLVDWEFSAGLRPSVWESSWLGNTTFAFSIEAGYRSTTIDTPLNQSGSVLGYPKEIDLLARWQGAFFQLQASF